MAPDSPPQPVSAGQNLRAQLFSVAADERFSLLAEMQGFTGDGAEILIEEPASPAIARPGDLLLRILYEGRIRMAYISKVDVGGEFGSESGGSRGTDAAEDEEEGARSSTDAAEHDEEQAEAREEDASTNTKEEEDGSSTDASDEEEEQAEAREDWGSTNLEDEEEKEQSGLSSTNSSSSDSVMEPEEKERLETRHMAIRVWPDYCVLVLFEGGCWRTTKQHPMQWLQDVQVENVHQRIITENERTDFDMTCNLGSFELPKQICILGFIGVLECSQSVKNFLTEFSLDMLNYKIDEFLGTGASCKVYGVDMQNAIKSMKLTKKIDDTDALENKEPREVIILSSFRSSVVVGFYQAWAATGIYKSYLEGSSEDDSGDWDDEDSESDDELEAPKYVAIQMEYCGSTLREFLDAPNREIDVDKSWFIFEEIVKGVQFIHRRGIIHRDLKPGNLFFGCAGTNTIKIGDFGHASWVRQYAAGEAGTPNRGTEAYCAPELAKTSPTDTEHNAKTTPTDKVDIYSLGVIFLELFYLHGSEHERVNVLQKLRTGEYPNPNNPDWYGDVELLKKLVAFCPSDRLSADEILEYISNRH